MAEVIAPRTEVATEAGAPVAVEMAPATADEAVPTMPDAPLEASDAAEDAPEEAAEATELVPEAAEELAPPAAVVDEVELSDMVPFMIRDWMPWRYTVTIWVKSSSPAA